MSKWIYQGLPLEEPPEGMFGFVYRITCLVPLEDGNRPFYIGMKSFYSTRTKVLSKKAAAEAYSGVGRRIKKQKQTSESDWRQYLSSSSDVKSLICDLGIESFLFEILEMCETKSKLSYAEAKWIIQEECLFKSNCLNAWLSIKCRKSNLK